MMTRTKRKSKRKKNGIRLAALLGLACVTLPLAAQSDRASTRTIEGRVLTSTGAGVPGAVVLLKDNKTLQVRSYIAQADGAYHFFGLSTEVNYTLRAENHDLTSKQKQVSVFDSHREVKLDLKLSQEIKRGKNQQSQKESSSQ